MALWEIRVGAVVLALLALIALRGKRGAYLAFVVLGLLYFPAQTQFRVHAPTCQQTLPTMRVLELSLQNYALIALFAGFCWMSWVQFRGKARFVWAVLATVLVGALVEIAEDMTGRGSCRVRDLVPAAAGALGAALVLAVLSRLFRKPGYVRIARPRAAGAPRQPVAPPRPAAAPRAVVPPQPAPPPPPPAPPRGFPAPPRDFSPTPGGPLDEGVPTEEVGVAPREIAQRLRATVQNLPAILQNLPAMLQRLPTLLQRLWMAIRRRRRAMVVAVVLLVLVSAAAFFVLSLEAPAPTVTEAPKAAPPPRALQVDAGGYYEPSYRFTIADQRFTRLTLRPDPFVTFSRIGTRQEAGCEDARIGADVVQLRCELDRVGTITIDGQFTSRLATSRLDAPVLSALITVTNTRGEVLYRARDSFRWHAPD